MSSDVAKDGLLGSMPLETGLRLELHRSRRRIDLQAWQVESDGRRRMDGGLELFGAMDVRALIALLRSGLWRLDRAEAGR